MPGDQETQKVHLFPYSGKTSNAALDHYQTKFDRHCVECGIIIANQAIEKSRICPRNHPVDLRGGERGHDRFMLSSWGRCQYCDNFISSHHKFCPCCGRVNDHHDANKNRRLHRALVKSERHTARSEINILLVKLNLYLGLNSQNEYYIESVDEAREKRLNLLALEMPPKDKEVADVNHKAPENDGPAVVIREVTARTSTPVTTAPELSLSGSLGGSKSVSEGGATDVDDAFGSLVNINDIVLPDSWSFEFVSEETVGRALTQKDPTQGSSKSCRPYVEDVVDGCADNDCASQTKAPALDRSVRSASQSSRQLRPRNSSRKSTDYPVPNVEPAKKKTRKSLDKLSTSEHMSKSTCDDNVVDLTVSSDEDRVVFGKNVDVKSESDN